MELILHMASGEELSVPIRPGETVNLTRFPVRIELVPDCAGFKPELPASVCRGRVRRWAVLRNGQYGKRTGEDVHLCRAHGEVAANLRRVVGT